VTAPGLIVTVKNGLICECRHYHMPVLGSLAAKMMKLSTILMVFSSTAVLCVGCLDTASAYVGTRPPSGQSKRVSQTLRSSGSSDGDRQFSAKPILVVGATGRVGRRVVQQLMAQNRPVRAVVRNEHKAQHLFGTMTSLQYPQLEIIKADLSRYEEYEEVLDKAVKGCESIVSVMGVVRFAKLGDFLPWRLFRLDAAWADRKHPYYGNYMAQKYLISLAEKHNVKRFVRLTGLGLAYSAFNPFSVLFNTLLSVNNRWGLLCEQALFDSKVPYVVLRPGGLTADERELSTTNLQVDASGMLPLPGRVGRSDVAALAIASADLPTTAPSYTLACRWCGEGIKPKPQGYKEEGFASAQECLDTVLASKVTSPSPPRMKPYGVAVGITAYAAGALSLKLATMLWKVIARLFRV
jgi:hypothetical protein